MKRHHFLRRFAIPACCAMTLALAVCAATTARAALTAGSDAPDFTAQASQGGHVFTYHLAEALKKGPVVLYFYPAAFSTGCSMEAHDFAEAISKFKALGAQVAGISMDNIEKLNKFSVSECRSAFPVIADPDGAISLSYQTRMPLLGMASRTSYVITPQGKIAFVYTAIGSENHVAHMLSALKSLQGKQSPSDP